MFIRTKDKLAGRTLMVLAPVSVLLFISYMYSINYRYQEVDDANLTWLSPLFALIVIALVMLSILATCHYVIKLFPISLQKKKIALLIVAILVGVLLIITCILVMYLSKSDLTMAITNALWAFYPLCSIALFIEAIALCFMYKSITIAHHQRLARYFLIAFLPQVFFSVVDFFILKMVLFQLTHLSYSVFSLFVFVDLCAYFFRHYNHDLDISSNKYSLKEKYALSDREVEVIYLLAKGQTNQNICDQLHISVNTVKSHIKRIYKKLGVSNRLQLINRLGGNGTQQ
jgi:DNA-binding CsgD family transcriptional regulator